MPLTYEVPEYKRIRVIIDTDAACEADDPYAIAQALMSKKLEVKAIFAEHFGYPESTKESYDEILTILEAMELTVPVYMGEVHTIKDNKDGTISPAAKFLIEEASKDEEKPLYVLCLGAITNIASAMRACPEIINKIRVIWIGGQDFDHNNPKFREFNSGNDIDAANYVVASGVDLWMIPANVYGSMNIGLAELQKKVFPCGKIGKHLYENMVQYNLSEGAGWTQGESWSLGDSPAVGVALNENCGTFVYREAPIFNEDTTLRFEEGRNKIRVYTSIDSRFILEDFIAKLQLLYGKD